MSRQRSFEDPETPDQWRVECFDNDGRCELEIFTGEAARRQALREMQLEPNQQG